MAGRALPNARFPIEERPERRPIHSTAGSPPHLSRNETRDASAGSPLFTPFPVFGPRGCFEAPSVMYSPTPPPFQATSGRALTRRCLFRFCHRHYTRATKPLLIVLAGPETTSGRGRFESTSVRMWRAAQERPCGHPFADVVCALPRFLSPADESSEIRRAPNTRHLSSSRSGALVRGDAR